MKKPYGQVAYESYCEHTNWKSLISGADLPQWEAVKPEIKAAWDAASKAVVEKIMEEGEDDDL